MFNVTFKNILVNITEKTTDLSQVTDKNLYHITLYCIEYILLRDLNSQL